MNATDKASVELIENLRPRLQKLIQVEPVLDHLVSIDKEQKERIKNKAKTESNRRAVDLLIDAVIKEPHSDGWFREFVDALTFGDCQHAADYMEANRPTPNIEAENDNYVRFIELLSPTLLDMKTPEVCLRCFTEGILGQDDREIVNKETENNGNRSGARELLKRIVRCRPGWFSSFLMVLRNTEHKVLYEELSGSNNDQKAGSDVAKEVDPILAEESSISEEGYLDINVEKCVDLYRSNSEVGELQDCSDLSEPDGESAAATAEGPQNTDIALRDYQMEVAKPALEGKNIIICLPTGSGKTRVAVYITKEHLDSRRRAGQPAKVAVLVNKVPLVEQHYSTEFWPFLKHQYKVEGVSGNSQLKISFTEIVKKNDVIICTAQILENFLAMSTDGEDEGLQLSDLTLVVIDECHHTQKGGVYNNIMMRYLKQKHKNVKLRKEQKEPMAIPQILGLTASPGVGGATKMAKAEEHILKICANLDAYKIMTRNVEENKKELRKKVATIEERTKDPFGDVIKNIMAAIHTHASLYPTCDFSSQNYEQWVVQQEHIAAKEENPKVRACAEHLRKYNEGLQLSNTIRMYDAFQFLHKYHEGEMKEKVAPEEEKPIQITDTERFLFNLFKENKDELQSLADNPDFENKSLSQLRVNILKEFTNREKAHGIIFTKTRRSAIALRQWIQENPKFEDVGVKAAHVIGGGDQSVVKPMTAAEQRDVLNKFRNGEVNLLIATTVLEEGLDISECNFVIRYGLVTNEISMIQAQGRARAADSSYTLVEVEGSGVAEKETVNEFCKTMMGKAISKIKIMDQEEYNKRITDFQIQAILERRLQVTKKKQKMIKNGSPSEVKFNCRRCNKHVCSGEDIEVIEGMHQVVISEQFRELYNKRENTSLQERLLDYETNSFIACNDCGQRWGSLMVHHGIEFPGLQVKNLVVTHKGKKISKCTKWSELPIKFPDIDLAAHASLMVQDDED